MNNIFSNPNDSPIGMPNMGSSFDPMQAFRKIMEIRNAEKMEGFNRSEMDRSRELTDRGAAEFAAKPVTRLASIGNDVLGRGSSQPMNSAVNLPAPISEYQRGLLNLRRDELSQKGDISRETLGIRRETTDISRRRAELAEKVAAGKATDAEKHEYALELLRERGADATELQNLRGSQAMGQIGERGRESRTTQEEGHQDTLAEIGARAKFNMGKPITATQERARVENAIAELMIKRPGLAGLIEQDPNTGAITISDEATAAERQMIENSIYGKPGTGAAGTDIKLEPERKPKAGKIESKYQVEVR